MKNTNASRLTVSALVLALAASSSIFAQEKKPENQHALPDSKTVEKYHSEMMESFKKIENAKVEAGVLSQEWADAQIAFLKAKQSDCKGQCILQKRDHFMAPHGKPKGFHKQHPKGRGPRFHQHRGQPKGNSVSPAGAEFPMKK